MTKLYVGINVSKDKFDVSYTIDGQNIFGYSTSQMTKKGLKSSLNKQKVLCKRMNKQKFIFAIKNG